MASPKHSFIWKAEKPKAQLPPRARREKSAFNEAVKTEIKQSRVGGVFFVVSVQEYDTHMHKLTQAGPCQDCHPMGHGLSVAPEPSRRRRRSERGARGTVVHLFPKENKSDQTHPQNMHTPTKTSFLHQTSLIPSLGMVFPTQDAGECHGKDESKGLPTPGSPA